jgi:hypothetical protein
MKRTELKNLIKETLDEMAKEKTVKINNSQLNKLISKGQLGFVYRGDFFIASELIKLKPGEDYFDPKGDDEGYSGWNFYSDESVNRFPWEDVEQIYMLTPVSL